MLAALAFVGLQSYADTLDFLQYFGGVESLDDLQYFTETDFESMGLPRLKARKSVRALQKLTEEQFTELRGGVVVTFLPVDAGYHRGPVKGQERMNGKLTEYVEEHDLACERHGMAAEDKHDTPPLDESKRFPVAYTFRFKKFLSILFLNFITKKYARARPASSTSYATPLRSRTPTRSSMHLRSADI